MDQKKHSGCGDECCDCEREACVNGDGEATYGSNQCTGSDEQDDAMRARGCAGAPGF